MKLNNYTSCKPFTFKSFATINRNGTACTLAHMLSEIKFNESKSDILGPIDYLSDIENLISFERAMFKDYGFKYRIKVFLLFMSISLL